MTRDYPDEITAELTEVLELMIFTTGPMAHVFQAAGVDVPKKAEAEQAFILHWLIKLALDHPDDWRKRAATELDEMLRKWQPADPKGS